MSSGSWSTEINTDGFDCKELTNNNLYIIFVGYLLPLLSPKVREYGKECLSIFRNAGKVAGNLVSMTEFGFEKIQDLSNNKEMIDFITRIVGKKNLSILPKQLEELAWEFSGDSNSEKESKQQTWKKLLNELKRISDLNKLDNTTVKP
jgi:hypothetical protein